MALFSSFNNKKFPEVDFNAAKSAPLKVDLLTGRVNASLIGEVPDPGDFFAPAVADGNDVIDESAGVEINTSGGKIDGLFLDMEKFGGDFRVRDEAIHLSTATTKEEVIARFGAPYWIDQLDPEETILFYEIDSGRFEVQFEFPGNETLGFITLRQPGVLADAAQRAIYKCDKPWPPTQG